MAKLIIPTPLRKFTNDQAQFQSSGTTVRAVIDELIATHEPLRQHLLDQAGQIRSFVRIYVGDEDMHALQHDATPVDEHTVVSIIPAIAGGSH
jgi:molybdopterin converting factor small subunit